MKGENVPGVDFIQVVSRAQEKVGKERQKKQSAALIENRLLQVKSNGNDGAIKERMKK